MFKFLVGFIVFAVWSLWARSVYICEIRHLCQQEIFVDSTLGTTASLRISREGEIISGEGQFMYTLASNNIAFTAGNRFFLQKVSRYLTPNAHLIVKIEGRYTFSERTVPAGMYDNLGLARAALIRDSLVRYYHVRAPQVTISSALVEDTDPEAATAPEEPIDFWIEKHKEEQIQYEFTNMTFSEVNFKNQGSVFTPRLPFIIYTDSLKQYVKAYPDHSIIIFTYMEGKGAIQQKKAQNRAQAVRTYLMRTKGINAPILIADPKQVKKKNANQSLSIQIQDH